MTLGERWHSSSHGRGEEFCGVFLCLHSGSRGGHCHPYRRTSLHTGDAKHQNSCSLQCPSPAATNLKPFQRRAHHFLLLPRQSSFTKELAILSCAFSFLFSLICKMPAINSARVFVLTHVCVIYFYSHWRASASDPGYAQINSPIKSKWANTKLPPHDIGIDTNGPNRGPRGSGCAVTGFGSEGSRGCSWSSNPNPRISAPFYSGARPAAGFLEQKITSASEKPSPNVSCGFCFP